MKKKDNIFTRYLPLSHKGWLVLVISLGTASMLCAILGKVVTTDVHVPMIFVLAVLVVALLTEGYFYGILAACVSVIGVNYAFTSPYFKLDFSVYGYPLTFMTMLAVGCAVSTLATRVKEQEKLKLEAEKEKVRANLLRAISHDLRTPLTAISGSINAVLENGSDLDDREKRELLCDAKNDAEWLCRMVENLLSITRISDGAINSIHRDLEVLEEVLSEAVVNFRKKNPYVDISVSVPEDMLFVPMDAMLIEQVLLNLMDNAVFHGETTSRISIKALKDGGFARVSVADNGRGIPKEAQAHLFDGMMKGEDRQSADKKRSMGIGLLVCRTIVEAHGGEISAKNLPEGGAEFTFTMELGDGKDGY